MSEQDIAHDTTPAPVASARGKCENCGVPLLGEHCYACGQPVKGLVRHFTSVIGDFADTVFNWDARLPRSLWPLLVRPGWLTREYFAGRRVRYVSPVRLFVTLAIVTFFVAQLVINIGENNIRIDDGSGMFSDSTTVEEVIKARDEAIADLTKAQVEAADIPGVGAGLRATEKKIREGADKRIAQLQERAADRDSDDGDERTPVSEKDFTIQFNDKPWDPVNNPVSVFWFPDFANDWLNAMIARAEGNIARMQKDPSLFKDAILGAVPSTLFILLPLFALMLKVLYVFKRRLYMEHLIVALHSHAFLCLALLLIFALAALQGWLASGDGALHALFSWLEAALLVWMPLYLLLMQKRVYGQGWLMTLLKYIVLGCCYFFLLSFGAAFTVLFSVVYG